MVAAAVGSTGVVNSVTEHCTYNVPVELLNAYGDCRVVLRGSDPPALARGLSQNSGSEIMMLQLLDINSDLEELETCGYGIPIEIVLQDPQSEASKLYRLTKLQRTHPLRIVIPVVVGFSKAVKVASALHLSIKLAGNQPETGVVEELCAVLDYFLHHNAVAQEIDYFSGLLTAQFHKLPITLWDIQEEDPRSLRYITDDGNEVVAREPFVAGEFELDSFRIAYMERMLRPEVECASCLFFPECGGYFKWPDQDFSCDGVKRVLTRLRDAAHELQDDLASCPVETAR